jgi:hypothetical protein
MMGYSAVALMLSLVITAVGCGSPGHTLRPQRENNRIVYSDPRTGRGVIVEIDSSFRYEEKITRMREGVEVEGFVFSDASGQVLVARLTIDEFRKITGKQVDPAAEPVRQYPPGTFFNPMYCDLIRAHAATVGDEVVFAAYKRSLLQDGITCETLNTLEALSSKYPDRVEAFNVATDRSIHIRTK